MSIETALADDVYRPPASGYDELFELDGTPRAAAAALIRELRGLGREGLLDAGRRRDAVFVQQGITFETSGEDGPSHERPFPLDLIPRVLAGEEWRAIKRGLAQRIRALNHFVDDVYHAREIVREGIVPWRLVAGCAHFARAAHGIRPPGGVYCHVAGCDLVRHSDGSWRVIEDNVRVPSGISYVIENRAAMARLVPQLFASYRVRPVEHYPQLLLGALRSVAPSAESEATVVVWTPGPANSAYFEHAFLARQMGVELVEASDLVVRDDVLYMRTTRGLERVHAVYRRLDDDFVDPLEFRPDSLLGVPGLVRAYRAGSVAIANALGTGVADDKAVYCFVPEMIRFYLAEEPILQNVPTYLLSDPEVLEDVLGRLDELVVKPTGESGGRGVTIGPHASEQELAELSRRLRSHPERWIAQDLVQLSTVPTVGADGSLQPRHVDLRPFAVFGERIDIVPGGLTRVALQEGSLIVNSSRGGGSKDTWVLENGDDADRAGEVGFPIPDTQPPTLPDLSYGAWSGQQQQQQQQPRAGAGAQSAAQDARGRRGA
ncbi:MAG TPA: circularly permuted type 2 ATP-grasp protein [Solirubrobacteraceae bacterium]|nr:circularly permuted type 2 ATP-grasp protein [Solirubrobacteraceae bacterium]